MIKGIIFDFDGLIIDTETPELQAWQELFDSFDIEFPYADYIRRIGNAYNDTSPLEILKAKLGAKIDESNISTSFQKRKNTLIEQQPLCDGVKDYLLTAKRLGLQIGLASSSSIAWIDHHISARNIKSFFTCIKTLEDVTHPKPDPELYFRTVNCMEIEPKEAIALEDSYNGIIAAKKAGIHAIAIPNHVTRGLDFSCADLQLNKLSEMSLYSLVDHFNNHHND